jgi:hypothetical protein
VLAFFQDRVSRTIWQLASKLHPPDLCLLRSQDYRREPLHEASFQFLWLTV